MIEASSMTTTRREGTAQMTTQPIRRTLVALAATGLLAVVPSTSAYAGGEPVLVESIDIRGTGDVREVVVRTSKKPTFSVFRLAEPFRVLVDVNDATMRRPSDLQRVNDGQVQYIATTQFNDEGSSILRVEVAIDHAVPYSARAEGNAVILTIGSETPVPGRGASAAPPAQTPGATKIGQLIRRMRRKTAVVSAPAEGADVSSAQVVTERLEDPPRLVIDVAGVSIAPKWQRIRINRNGVKTVRVADKGGSVRIVLDLASAVAKPVADIRTFGGRFEILIDPAAPERSLSVAEASEGDMPDPIALPERRGRAEAPVAQVEVDPAEASPVSATRTVMVQDVLFEPKDGFVRLTLVLEDESARVVPEASESSTPILRVLGARLPLTLERTLDVTEVAPGVLDAISTYNERGNTTIVANIRPGTEHRHWRKGNRLMWDFRNRSVPLTQRLLYDERSTAGYQASTAALTISKAMPAQRRVRYTGRRISLDLQNADIQNVLRLLADVSKLNIVAADDVNGKITIKLRNVPWDQALDIILRSKQLDKVRNGNIIRVAPITVLQEEEDLRVKRAKSRVQLEPLSVRLIPVSYAVAAEVAPQVQALLSERGKVNIDKRTNVLVVEDIQEVLIKVERLVRTLDTQTPQVLIEARIVEARSNFSRELGIQWGGQFIASQQTGNSTGLSFPNLVRVAGGADDQQNQVVNGVQPLPFYAVNLPATVGAGTGGALGFTLGSVGGSALVNIRLSAAESQGKVKIISAPKVVTLDNAQARILSGERVPITVITANGPTTRFIEANLELNVTPHVTQDGSILMNIIARKNELSDRVDNLGVPGIITNEATTEMIVRDGDTAVLGGIYRRTASENESYVPWLGKIPVLGWLFKNRSRSDARNELLIFISPRIVNRSAALVNPN